MSLASQRAIARALGLMPEEVGDVPEPEQFPDFDGGAREPAPLPANPVGEHNDFVLGVVHRAKWGAP
jgi:hypothetical protein